MRKVGAWPFCLCSDAVPDMYYYVCVCAPCDGLEVDLQSDNKLGFRKR